MSPEGEQLLFGGTWGTFRSQQKVGSPANDFPRLLRLCRNVCQLKVQPTAPEKRKTSTKNLRTLKLGGQKPAPNSGNDPYRKKGKKRRAKAICTPWSSRNKVPISLSSGTPAKIIKKTSLRRCECVPEFKGCQKCAGNIPKKPASSLGDRTRGLKLKLHHWQVAHSWASYPAELS